MQPPNCWLFHVSMGDLESGERNNGKRFKLGAKCNNSRIAGNTQEKHIIERCLLWQRCAKMMLIVLPPVYLKATIKLYDLISLFHQCERTKRRFSRLNALIYLSFFMFAGKITSISDILSLPFLHIDGIYIPKDCLFLIAAAATVMINKP